ncbi:MAG: sulfurtransferase TusA family protein [Actinobacteria bacterium]|nr:sulfurtransferase TusA family protein [Actinomycetota bacterium]
MEADQTLDCVGLYCPMPIVKTSQQIKELADGEVLEVISDDEGIKSDMPAWCDKTGHEFLGLEEDSGEIKVYIRK